MSKLIDLNPHSIRFKKSGYGIFKENNTNITNIIILGNNEKQLSSINNWSSCLNFENTNDLKKLLNNYIYFRIYIFYILFSAYSYRNKEYAHCAPLFENEPTESSGNILNKVIKQLFILIGHNKRLIDFNIKSQESLDNPYMNNIFKITENTALNSSKYSNPTIENIPALKSKFGNPIIGNLRNTHYKSYVTSTENIRKILGDKLIGTLGTESGERIKDGLISYKWSNMKNKK